MIVSVPSLSEEVTMSIDQAATRRQLHGVAELLIAGPQYREHGTIRLRVTPGGFGGVASGVTVDGVDLVRPAGRVPLAGRIGDVAAAAGIDCGAPDGLYADGSGLAADDELDLNPGTVAALTDWFALGDRALREFAAGSEPVLWPEHFDLGITVDEVNYGVSPGDSGNEQPYAYIGPWTPRTGEFWNAPFGALRAADEFGSAAALVAFFAEGRARSRE